jgi:hypothetical protein
MNFNLSINANGIEHLTPLPVGPARFSPTIDALGWTLLHFLWQGAAVALLLGLFLALSRKSRPQVRYLAACAALTIMCVAALATGVWQFRVSHAANSGLASATPPTRVRRPAAKVKPSAEPLAVSFEVADGQPDPPKSRESIPVTLHLEDKDGTPVEFAGGSANRFGWLTAPLERWLPWMVGTWALGVGCLSLRLAWGWRVVRKLRAGGTETLDEHWLERFDRLRQSLGVAFPVRLLCSASATVPMVIGWLKPVVLVPAGLLTGLSTEQLEALLAHELAHIRRHDYLVNLLQNAVETLLFYHPAVWWVSGQIRNEREHCCDDLAAACGGALEYARALTALAELRQSSPALGLAANGGSLLARIRRLAGITPPARRGNTWPVAATLLTIGFLTTLLLSTGPSRGEPKPVTANRPTEPDTVTVSGGLVDDHGRPVVAANIWLSVKESWAFDFEGPSVIAQAVSTVDGHFQLKPRKSIVERFVKSDTTLFQLWVYKPGLALKKFNSHGRLPNQPIKISLPPEPVGKLRLHKPDGAPCSDATVTISMAVPPDGPISTIPEVIRPHLRSHCGPDGLVRIPGVSAERIVMLEFDTKEFGRQCWIASDVGQALPAELTLRKTATIEGRLVFPNAVHIDPSTVKLRIATLKKSDDANDVWFGQSLPTIASDGRFRIPTIGEGLVRILIDEPDDLGYRAQLSAAPSVVQPNQTLKLEIPMQKTVRVTRLIRDVQTKKPIPGVGVHLQNRNQYHIARTNAEGRFTIGLLPEVDYSTACDLPDGYMYRLTKRTLSFETTRAPAGAASCELGPIEVLHGRTIEGIVVDASGRPFEGVHVGADWISREETRAAEGMSAAGGPRLSQTTDSGGRFQLQGIDPDAAVTLTPFRDQIVLGNPIEVSREQTEALRLQTENFDFHALEGRIVDLAGKPISGAHVIVQCSENSRIPYQHAPRAFDDVFRGVTDADGRFKTPPHYPAQYKYHVDRKSVV